MEEHSEVREFTAEIVSYVTQRLRTVRLERGLTVQQVADRCDMERPNLSRLEAGRTNPTLRTLCSLCYVLGIGIRDLFPPLRPPAGGSL